MTLGRETWGSLGRKGCEQSLKAAERAARSRPPPSCPEQDAPARLPYPDWGHSLVSCEAQCPLCTCISFLNWSLGAAGKHPSVHLWPASGRSLQPSGQRGRAAEAAQSLGEGRRQEGPTAQHAGTLRAE